MPGAQVEFGKPTPGVTAVLHSFNALYTKTASVFVSVWQGGRALNGLRWRNRTGVGAAAAIAGAVLLCPQALFCRQASADTLEQALIYAYANNPQINSQR